MALNKEKIRQWLQHAKDEGNISHVIIVCDTFDYEDYPVNVKIGQDVYKHIKHYSYNNMQRVMEVYNLKMDIERQLSEPRAYYPDDFNNSKSSSEEDDE